MEKGRSPKKKRKFIKVIITLILVWFALGVIKNSGSIFVYFMEQTGADAVFHQIPVSEEWNLLVVNRWNEIPEDYEVTLTELENEEKVDSRIYPDLQEMFDNMREEGIYPFVREGYRTAKEWVALPGTSEHQLGLAVDINADKEHSDNEEVYEWLAQNAYKHGFILRYPQGKEDITGTAYEPWHYRYVGEEAAKEIFDRQICLEEYFEKRP